VPADSEWFNGHFPGNPVLPGIAQIGMVMDALRSSLGRSLRIVELNRVRFRQMILPEELVGLEITPRPTSEGCYTFRILRKGEPACSGTIIVAPVAERL
jgi:3-hydroxymyristoyl/3-hydroxydecanoyl-(acyl carrier protein) dehydratase